MIEQHMGSFRIGTIGYFIVNSDRGLTQRSGDGAFQFETGAEHLSLFYFARQTHFHFTLCWIGLYNGFDLRWSVADKSVKSPFSVRIGLGSTNMVQPTRC